MRTSERKKEGGREGEGKNTVGVGFVSSTAIALLQKQLSGVYVCVRMMGVSRVFVFPLSLSPSLSLSQV